MGEPRLALGVPLSRPPRAIHVSASIPFNLARNGRRGNRRRGVRDGGTGFPSVSVQAPRSRNGRARRHGVAGADEAPRATTGRGSERSPQAGERRSPHGTSGRPRAGRGRSHASHARPASPARRIASGTRRALPVRTSVRALRPRAPSVHNLVVATASGAHLRLAVAIALEPAIVRHPNRNAHWGSSHESIEGAPQAPRGGRGRCRRHRRAGRRVGAGRGHQGRGDRVQHPAHRGRGRAARPDDHARGHRPQRRDQRRRAPNLISANNSAGSVTIGNIIGSTTFANQTASLRGLGGPATLVLVNGKRLGTFSGGISGAEGVNLAAIPFAAVERVEVLKDGASAVYGSDAVAGVINFIMRSDFTGVTAHAYYGSPTRGGGGDQYELSGTFGIGDLSKDRYNAFFSVNYQEQKSLDQRDREFSRTSYLPDIGLNTTSGPELPRLHLDGRHRQPGFPGLRPLSRLDLDRRPLPLRSLRGAGRAVDPEHQAVQPVRLGALPDQRRLAGVRDRPLLASGGERRDPAAADLRPDPDDVHAVRRVRDPAAADQPVLSARPGRGRRRRRPAAQRALSLRRVRQPQVDRHERGVADRPRCARHGVELGLRRLVQLQPEHREGAPDLRHSAVLAHPAAPEQRHREPVRAEHAGDLRPGAGHRLHRRGLPRQAVRLRLRLQGLERDLQAAGRPTGAGARHAMVQGEPHAEPVRAAADRQRVALRRQPAEHRPLAHGVRAVRRAQHTHRAQSRSEPRRPLRPLRRLRQHDQPEGQHALAAAAPAAGARVVGHGLPGPDALPAVESRRRPACRRPACRIRCAVRIRTIRRAPTTRTATRSTR